MGVCLRVHAYVAVYGVSGVCGASGRGVLPVRFCCGCVRCGCGESAHFRVLHLAVAVGPAPLTALADWDC